ncbi:methyltransferase domain-containing protein [Pontiellaceae bacterium B1224]|nr:methyltransferase domain-containing protein [Pontiellaceae bacterium B1224]
MDIEIVNTILYCERWSETVAFYRDVLALPVKAGTGWLVEFAVASNACLSVADARRTSIQSGSGAGITLTFKVANLHDMHEELGSKRIAVEPIRDCRMGGQAFFLRDPEGNRLEFWADSPWDSPEMVARLSATPPNAVLMRFAAVERQRGAGNRLLDIGCGAGCNAVPLARAGWNVLGLDRSEPMLKAANGRAAESNLTELLKLETALMDRLPIGNQNFDFIVAHGVWNLARSATEFRAAVHEAARAAKPGAPLFVYTFSRATLPPDTEPLADESFIFQGHAGRPQCYLTKEQLTEELKAAGFEQEPGYPITEYPQVPGLPKPAILEGIFRRV